MQLPAGGGFGEGSGGVVAVDGGGGAEDDAVAVVVAHGLQKGEGGVDVVAVVLDGLDDGLADGLVAGEVDDGLDVVLGEDLLKLLAAGDVALVEFGSLAGDLLDAVYDGAFGVEEVVGDDDVLVALEEFDGGVRADEAGSACEKDG